MLIEHSTDALKTYYEMGYKAGFKKGVDSHPVKELTDEEIITEAEKHDWLGLTSESEWQPEIDFAKAILRKAQEK